MDRPSPRTLLERLIQESDRTAEEVCQGFESRAREMGIPATLSVRQLSRWTAGEVDNARPSARRVARALWGHDFKTLLGPPLTPAITDDGLPQARRATTEGEWCRDAGLPQEIDMASEESARFVRRAGVGVTSELLEQLDADVRHLATEYLRQPPYVSFQALSARRHDLFEVIDSHPRPVFLPDLYHLAGQLSALLAHASSDLDQPYAAGTHARSAWLCADLSGDDSLRAYVRWVQSQIAYWQGNFALAAQLADAGRRYAAVGSSVVRLASQLARSLAATGDNRGVDSALTVAAESRERARHEVKPAGVFDFAPAKAAYYASEARLSLGGVANVRRAVQDAEEAVVLCQDGKDGYSAEMVAAAQLDVVLAHLALGSIDAAQTHIRPVLELTVENRTMPIVQRMGKVRMALERTSLVGSLVARDLGDEIQLFCAYPAARGLPTLPE